MFKHGDPCEICITKAMCVRLNGEADTKFCDLPEKYYFWRVEEVIKKLKKKAKKGDKKSIDDLAKIGIDLIRIDKKQFEDNLKFMKKHIF